MNNRTVTFLSYISVTALNLVKLVRIREFTCPGGTATCGRATLVNKFAKTWVGKDENVSEIDQYDSK